jgi:hypothetical protein
MRTLVCLLATAGLVGGVTIASAQSASPTGPSGLMAGGGNASSATQGVGGTQRIETTGQATKLSDLLHQSATGQARPNPGFSA